MYSVLSTQYCVLQQMAGGTGILPVWPYGSVVPGRSGVVRALVVQLVPALRFASASRWLRGCGPPDAKVTDFVGVRRTTYMLAGNRAWENSTAQSAKECERTIQTHSTRVNVTDHAHAHEHTHLTFEEKR